MPKKSTFTCALVGLAALALAGCGSSSTAPGVVLAPSQGATQASTPAAAASASSSTTPATTTSASSTSTTPLPAALKTKPTVTVPKGAPPKTLVVKDLIKGTGPAVTASSTVTAQYVGVLYKNGKQFDASWDDGTGQPAQLPLSGTIPGWQKGLVGMKVGGRRELIVPPSLAYGSTAQGKIPANSTLVFVIDLHGVSS